MNPASAQTTHPALDAYYDGLAALAHQGAIHEQATRAPFTRLLEAYAKPAHWTLVLEKRQKLVWRGGRAGKERRSDEMIPWREPHGNAFKMAGWKRTRV